MKENAIPEPFTSIQFVQLKAFASILETSIKISEVLLVPPLRLVTQGALEMQGILVTKLRTLHNDVL
jgi:hypothetical protein